MTEPACQRLLELVNSRGVDILQVNGQRVYGPPKNWSGPPPARGCEVFVGRLPRDMFEDELVPLFESAGPLYNLRLMMDFSGSNRGFAFAQYQTRDAAQRAIALLHDLEVRPGRPIAVVRSVENCRLFVGNVPADKSREELLRELQRRVAGVTKVFLYKHPADKTRNRGYAFVEFEDHRAAAMARRELLPGKALLWGQRVNIDWAVPEPHVDHAVMQKVTKLYIRNLNVTTTEATIREVFESISGPDSVSKVKKIKDFAFVHFHRREDAQKNLEHWNDREFDGSVIEVTWAKPADKLQHIKKQYTAMLHENGAGITYRSNGNNNIQRGRQIVKSHHQECFDFSQQQPILGSPNNGALVLSNLLDDFPYSAAPHFIPFTRPDGLNVPLLPPPQPDLHPSMAPPGPMLAPSPMEFAMATYQPPPPSYIFSGNQISSFEASYYS